MGNSAPVAVAEKPRVPVPVTLHVYDLGRATEMQALNSILGVLGTGAFHCGVEVYGREWSFHYIPYGTGVFECAPTKCPAHSFRTSVDMGVTLMSEAEVTQLIRQMRKEWPGTCYDVLRRNCCHSCNDLCIRLGVGPIPGWTISLAGAGATVKDVVNNVTGVLNPTLLTGRRRSVEEPAKLHHKQTLQPKATPRLATPRLKPTSRLAMPRGA